MKHFRFMIKYWHMITVILFSGLFASLLEGAGISLVFPILDAAQGFGKIGVPFPFNNVSALFSGMTIPTRLRVAALLLVAITGVKAGMLYLNNIFNCKLQIEVSKYFKMNCFEQLMKVGLGYFNKRKGADYQTVCDAYASNLATLVSMVGAATPKILNIIVLFSILMLLSWQMTLASILLMILASVALRFIYVRAEIAGKAFTEAIKRINRKLIDAILGMKVIRLFNRERDTIGQYENEINLYNTSLYKLTETRGSVQPVFEFTGMFILSIIIILASFVLFGPGLNGLGILVIFLIIFNRIISPVLSINQLRVAIAGDLPTCREVFRFLEAGDKQYLKNGARQFTGLKHGIEFKDVDFGYDPESSPVLKSVSFAVPKGAKAGIVGPSGAGKSTITELLLRFYDPQAGRIMVDGVDLREYDINSWRKHVGVVSQDVFLFNDTIRANIAYATPEASREDIESAAKKAHAHEFIVALPAGYDTIIGDRGVLLSGGQRQRMAIARAIIINPEILIFDEATSALDTESEKIVQEAIDEVGRGRTVITIAHRLSTVFDSDKIVVIEDGRIIEEGIHNNLVRLNGLYARLIRMQNLEVRV